MTTTVIRDAAWVAAYDPVAHGHVYRRGVDVAFTDDRIVHVGPGFDGAADVELDGRERFVMPGLVNVHSHPLSEPLNQGFLDELGSPGLYNSSLYEFMPVFRPDAAGMVACAERAYAELLASGTTTVVDLSVPYEGWLETLAASGLRGVVAPMFRSARWFTRNGHRVEYEWEADEGRGAMDRALDVLAAARDHEAGRFTGMVAPAQIDTCTPDLLREAADTARGLGVPLQIHAAQSLVEFHEITRRHGLTPIQWLDRLGLLGPATIVGHGIFLDHHHAVHWPRTHDLDRLVASGTAVAHCPTVFQRRGITLETAGRYVRAGVRLGLGTDTYPHNTLEELRTALYLSRVVSRDVFDVRTRELFHAATLGGADLLGRDDVGRLAPGAKADVVMVDLDHPAMRPVRDPLKSLIYVAAERAVRDVWVDGRRVVADGRVTTLDALAAARRVEAAQRRAEARLPELDRAGRDHWTIAPPVLPFADD